MNEIIFNSDNAKNVDFRTPVVALVKFYILSVIISVLQGVSMAILGLHP